MKKLAIETNKHLKDPKKREKLLMDAIVASARIEGIELTPERQKKIAKRVSERQKKSTR